MLTWASFVPSSSIPPRVSIALWASPWARPGTTGCRCAGRCVPEARSLFRNSRAPVTALATGPSHQYLLCDSAIEIGSAAKLPPAVGVMPNARVNASRNALDLHDLRLWCLIVFRRRCLLCHRMPPMPLSCREKYDGLPYRSWRVLTFRKHCPCEQGISDRPTPVLHSRLRHLGTSIGPQVPLRWHSFRFLLGNGP